MNPVKTDFHSLALVRTAVSAIVDKKGNDIVTIDVRERSNITDYFIITSGLNPPHLKALFNETQVRLKNEGALCFGKDGAPDSGWMVADYLDIIIHFFISETRNYYALDKLYEDAPRVDMHERT